MTFRQWHKTHRSQWCNKCGPVRKGHRHWILEEEDLPYQWGGEKWAEDAWRTE